MATRGGQDDINVKIGADASGVESGMLRAASAVTSGVAGIKGQIAALSALGGAFAGVSQALTEKVLAFVRDMFTAFPRVSEEVRRLSDTLSITREEASGLRASMDDIGITTEEYIGIVQRVTLQLRQNEERFTQLGVKTRDSNGNLLNSQQILKNTINTLKDYKDGTDRNLASSELLGRSFASVAQLTRMTDEVIADSTKTLEEFGAVMTENDIKAAREFELASNDLGDAIESMAVGIGKMLLPYLQSLTEMVRAVLPYAFIVLKGSIGGILAFFEYLKLGILTIWDLGNGLARAIMGNWKNAFTMMAQFLTGDFRGAIATAKAMATVYADELGGALERTAKRAEETNKAVKEIFLGREDPGQKETGGTKTYKSKPDKNADKNLLEKWKKELQEMRDATDAFRTLELSEEQKFWETKLSLVAKGSEAEKMVRHELTVVKKKIAQEELREALSALSFQMEMSRESADEQVKIADAKLRLMKAIYGEDSKEYVAAEREKTRTLRDQAEQRKRMATEEIELRRSLATVSMNEARDQIEFEKNIGLINDEERLARLRELSRQEYEDKRETLKQKLDLERENQEARQKLLNEIQVLDREREAQIKRENQDTALSIRDRWMEILDPIQQAFDTTLKGIIMGTQTLRQGLQNIFTAILGEFISLGIRMLREWVAKQLAMTVFMQGQQAARTALELTASTAEAVAARIAAFAQVSSYAAVAGAAAVASAAAIPVYGWMIAPAAGAGAYASAMSFSAGLLASAAGGWWEVPGDQVAQIHKKEMVLPADKAEGLREMLEGGGGAGGINLKINALDGESVRRLFQREGSHLYDALRQQIRNFKGELK